MFHIGLSSVISFRQKSLALCGASQHKEKNFKNSATREFFLLHIRTTIVEPWRYGRMVHVEPCIETP